MFRRGVNGRLNPEDPFMRYAIGIVLLSAVAITLATVTSRGEAREAEAADLQLAQEVEESLMRQKLEHAQELLGSLSIGDYERMILHSKELQRISLEARWSQPHSPAYAELGEDFRAALGRIAAAAEKQNIDGASLNYVQVVLTCIQCHKIVREGEQMAQQAGAGDPELIARLLDVAAD
jgi:hypothetical protein